jgi:hypothetical protein
MSGQRNNDEPEQPKRGYRYRPADQPASVPDEDDDDLTAKLDDEDDELDDEFDEDDEADEDGDEEPPSEFWPAAELLKGATITDAELELSYSASVYVNTPAAELRLWLRMPDGTNRLVQIDEPHAVWLYRQAHHAGDRDFEEYPDHRFELPSTDLRVLRARRRRELIDRQLSLHEELVTVGEELEEIDRDSQEEDNATADWPGTRWP